MTSEAAIPTVKPMTLTPSAEIPDGDIDETAVGEFAGHLFGLFTGGALTYLIEIGRRTGLFTAATGQSLTCEALAERAGLNERYVREWLAAMVTGGIFEYEPSTDHYWLPTEHAICLTRGAADLAPVGAFVTELGRHVTAVADAFRSGGGVPWDAYKPEIHDLMDILWGPLYEETLVDTILPLAPGLVDRLRAGARVADVACGTGAVALILAEAFPASTFVGYDLDPDGLERGRAGAAAKGLTNLTFEQCDAAELRPNDPFDVIVVFNAVHDQIDPASVFRRIREALVPGGLFLMNEPRMHDALENNLDNPMAPFTYSVSTLHCMTVSLAHGGAGLGTAWGEQTALQLLDKAGFSNVTVEQTPGDPGNALFATSAP
jgi:SAM-dependent methyltransferase